MSDITTIIKDNGLRIGDPMKDVEGREIPDSVVLGANAWAHRLEGGYGVEQHNVLLDETHRVRLAADAVLALAAFADAR